MNDEQSSGGGTTEEPVGSVGEETAKLFTAISGWATDQARDQTAGASQAAHGLAAALRSVNNHVGTGGEDCRYCPVCQVIHAARETSPEVRAHLGLAASSLLHAAAEVLATRQPRSSSDPGVEKIDLGATGEPWGEADLEQPPAGEDR